MFGSRCTSFEDYSYTKKPIKLKTVPLYNKIQMDHIFPLAFFPLSRDNKKNCCYSSFAIYVPQELLVFLTLSGIYLLLEHNDG